MPYEVKWSNKANSYVVINESTGKVIKKGLTKAEAEKQLRALCANEPKSKRG